ncbi:MAG: SDR family NAD(P)-dependent oxidoreductase, partial [Alphaproteobacteria bacterium]|nr:SDR family NAD(P)-dependent oxidoreductase [Alphaproteobacteria bacterium]
MTTGTPYVAVTGATGLIGRHLLRALTEAGAKVKAFARRPANDESVDWITGSLTDGSGLAKLVDGVDAVVHLAGAIKALRRDDYFQANLAGTRALADAIVTSAPAAKLIHVSSLAAREPGLSDYAASKRAAEQLLRGYHDRIAMTVLRPPAVYGPGDLETLRMFKMAAAGWVLVPGVRGARLSLVHVADAVAAIMAALAAPALGPEPIEFDDGASGGHDWPAIGAAAMDAVRV